MPIKQIASNKFEVSSDDTGKLLGIYRTRDAAAHAYSEMHKIAEKPVKTNKAASKAKAATAAKKTKEKQVETILEEV